MKVEFLPYKHIVKYESIKEGEFFEWSNFIYCKLNLGKVLVVKIDDKGYIGQISQWCGSGQDVQKLSINSIIFQKV